MISTLLLVVNFLSKSDILLKETNKHAYTVTAYSTSPSENGGYRITSTGKPLRKGCIAVDPRYIRFGSRIYVPGYGWGIANDVGRAIKGRHIDVCIASRHLANRWGRQKLKITVLPPNSKK